MTDPLIGLLTEIWDRSPTLAVFVLIVFILVREKRNGKAAETNQGNGKSHSYPCGPLQAIQGEVLREKETNKDQWDAMKEERGERQSLAKTVHRIDRTTSALATTLKVRVPDGD